MSSAYELQFLKGIYDRLGLSLPLPTGAATSANQATGNASLSSLDTKMSTLLTYSPFREYHMDAFQRLRTASPVTIFDSKQILDTGSLFWDNATISGAGGNSVYTQAGAETTLSVSASTAGHRVRQTKRWFNYQPGKSQLVILTATVGAAATGITRRLGLYETSNGLFFEFGPTTNYAVVRTKVSGSVVDNKVAQADWNVDKLDGSGPSGVTMNLTRPQIFFIDFEWLGVGSVRYGIFYRGKPIVCHIQSHANEVGNTGVYMSSPNLPIRWAIENDGTGGAASLKTICCSVISEGGVELVGAAFSIDRGITGYATGSNTNLHPLISMRLKSTALSSTIIPEEIDISNNDTTAYRWALLLNPTVAGVDAASWVSVANSAIEYDVSRTTTNTLSGGTIIHSGYVGGGLRSTDSTLNTALRIGSTIAGVADQLVLAVQNLTAAGGSTYWAAIHYSEPR